MTESAKDLDRQIAPPMTALDAACAAYGLCDDEWCDSAPWDDPPRIEDCCRQKMRPAINAFAAFLATNPAFHNDFEKVARYLRELDA